MDQNHYKEPQQNKVDLQKEIEKVQKKLEDGEETKENQLKEKEFHWEIYK